MEIRLRKSKRIAMIDERDSHLAAETWSWHNTLGVVRYDAKHYDPITRRTPHIILARAITNAFNGGFVIHLDGDRLNNKRSNLLLLSSAQYAQYVKKRVGQSGYIGVRARCRGFDVTISSQHVGNYTTAKDAARAYDDEAIHRYGASARVNFPKKFKVCHECHRAHFELETTTSCAKCADMRQRNDLSR